MSVIAKRDKVRAACIVVIGLLSSQGASAFYCYVPEKPESPVALRAKPDDGAKLVVRMPPGSMIRSTNGIRERNGWVHVSWYESQSATKAGGKGWVKHDLVYGGECED